MTLVGSVMDGSLRHDAAKEALGIVGEIAAVGVVFEQDLALQAVRTDVVHGHAGGSIARVISGPFLKLDGK